MYYYRPKIGNYIKLFFLTTLVFSVLSCGVKKTEVKEIPISKNPKILFLNYRITKTTINEKNIAFQSKVLAKGKLKNSSNKYIKKPSIGDLKCTQLDKKSSPLYSVFIKNPFIKFIEVVDDSLNFKTRQVKQNSVPLSLRLQLHPDTKYIEISEVLDTLKHAKKLIKTTLE